MKRELFRTSELRNIVVLSTLGVVILLSGCVGISSVPVGSSYDRSEGTTYSLPTTLIPISVTIDEKNQAIELTAIQPVYKADLQHTYRVGSSYSPLHAETAKITVSSQGLLEGVNLVSDSRLSEIITEVTKSAIIAENATGAQTKRVLFKTSIDVGTMASDPTYVDELNSEIRLAILKYVKHEHEHSRRSFLAGHINEAIIEFEVQKLTMASSKRHNSVSGRGQCSVGVCYRIAIPYSISARFFDGSYNEAIISVPNGSPIFATAIRRGLFSDWTTDVTFVNGMPTSYTRTTTSEVEGIVAIPGQIVAAQIAAIKQVTDRSNARKSQIDAKKALEAVTAESALKNRPLFVFKNSSAKPTGQQASRLSESSAVREHPGNTGANNPPKKDSEDETKPKTTVGNDGTG